MKKILYITFLLCWRIESVEQEALLTQQDTHPVIIYVQNNGNIRPDPARFLKILTDDVPCLPADVNKIILQYARWQRDEKGEADAKALDFKLRELQKSKYLSAAGVICGTSMIIIGAIALSNGDLLDPQAIKSWATPVVATIFGTSVIANGIDRWRTFKRSPFIDRKFFRNSLSRILHSGALPGYLLLSLEVSDNSQKMGNGNLIMGTTGFVYSTYFLREIIKIQNLLPLRLQELRQHLRAELYEPRENASTDNNADDS